MRECKRTWLRFEPPSATARREPRCVGPSSVRALGMVLVLMDAWKRLALENKTLSCSTLWLQLIWCDENKWICQISNGVDSVYERESTRSARIVRCVVDADIGCFYCAHGRGTATTYFLVGDPMDILDIHQNFAHTSYNTSANSFFDPVKLKTTPCQ
jgi:hypothetical protein